MAEINKVIAAVLRDVTEARASADLVSRDLARQYAADDVMKYFSVPKVQVGSLQFEIKYAVESVQEVPFQSAASQEKLSLLVKRFKGNAAKSLQASISGTTQANKLYKQLGEDYPGKEWIQNVEELLEDELKILLTTVPDGINAAVTSAEKNIKTKLANVVPVAKRVESLFVIPNSDGEFEVLSFDAQQKPDLKVGEGYENADEAVKDAILVIDALQKKSAAIDSIVRNGVKKTDTAVLTIGNRRISIATSKFLGSGLPDKLILSKFLTEKEKFKALATPGWITGRIISSSSVNPTRPSDNPSISQADDLTILTKSTGVVADLFRSFRADLEKLKGETSESKINVQVETQKLKDLDPTKLLTLQFKVDMQDFSVTDEDHISLIN